MRWLTRRAAYAPGIPGRIVVIIDRSSSMTGEPTIVVNQALPMVRQSFPSLRVIDFNEFSDIEPAIKAAIPIRPERSVVISDGHISGADSSAKMTGAIDAIFCGDERELQELPRQIKTQHSIDPQGAYTLWKMTRGRGVLSHFRWGQGPRALFDLIVHRQRRIIHQRLPDQHIYVGGR
jgi:hypothetical protein